MCFFQKFRKKSPIQKKNLKKNLLYDFMNLENLFMILMIIKFLTLKRFQFVSWKSQITDKLYQTLSKFFSNFFEGHFSKNSKKEISDFNPTLHLLA
jgi:hypothetical protein